MYASISRMNVWKNVQMLGPSSTTNIVDYLDKISRVGNNPLNKHNIFVYAAILEEEMP